MRRTTLIVADCAANCSARIAVTGMQVFAALKVCQAVDAARVRLRGAFHWRSEAHVHAALDYAATHPRQMEARPTAEREAPARLDRLWRELSGAAPCRRRASRSTRCASWA